MMGKVTTTKYQCDRCGFLMDEKPCYQNKATLEGFVDLQICAGDNFKWSTLCEDCNYKVQDSIRDLLRSVIPFKEEKEQ